ncbi:MAG: iron-containing alcohol dehydrogenase family protein [Acidimicrobiia bacterium]
MREAQGGHWFSAAGRDRVTPYDQARTSSFLGPQEVLAGDGALTEAGPRMARLAQGEVLLVTDAHLLEIGVADRAVGSLEQSGLDVGIYGEVTGEPDLEIGERVAEVARSRQWAGIVGLGGGSSLDLAKIAAAAATNDLAITDFVGVDRLAHGPRPLLLIPTTAGTGSEATSIAMISVEGRKQIINDRRLVPHVAVLDATLTFSLPPPVTAATGLDALSHAAETFISTRATALTEAMSRQAMRMLSTALRRAFYDGSDLEARRATLYGAHIAGRALNASSVLGHSIAYTIANRAHLAHGITCAMALPFCLAYSLPDGEVRGRLDVLAEEVAHEEVRTGLDLLRWLEELKEELGVPDSLEVVGIEKDETLAMAQECLELYPRPNNPVPLQLERLGELYESLWRGDVQGYVQHVLNEDRS